MWSEVSQRWQPHDGVLETNKQAEQKKQIDLRAQKAGEVVRKIIEGITYSLSGGDARGVPHTLVSDAVDVGQLKGEAGERGYHKFIKAYAAFGTDRQKIEKNGRFERTRYGYVPNFGELSRVGVIHLFGIPDVGELAHQGSTHWTRTESASLEDIVAIEEDLEAIQTALPHLLGGLAVVQIELAS